MANDHAAQAEGGRDDAERASGRSRSNPRDGTVTVEFEAVELIVMVPVRVPVAVGLNIALIVQLDPGASVLRLQVPLPPQLKSPADIGLLVIVNWSIARVSQCGEQDRARLADRNASEADARRIQRQNAGCRRIYGHRGAGGFGIVGDASSRYGHGFRCGHGGSRKQSGGAYSAGGGRPGNRRIAGVCDLSRELLGSPEITVAVVGEIETLMAAVGVVKTLSRPVTSTPVESADSTR